MSGGHFSYKQYEIDTIADDVEELIAKDAYYSASEQYSPATIAEFRTGLRYLRMAAVYAQRIDWLVSCDDGEDSFHRRLAVDLKAIDGFTSTIEHLEHSHAKLLIRIAALEQRYEDDNK